MKYKTKSQQEIKRRAEIIDITALKFGWTMFDFQKNIFLARYKKDDMKINVYLSTMSVTTYIDHPKRGKGQLYRKRCTIKELDLIFKNPRVHTSKGYFTKNY